MEKEQDISQIKADITHLGNRMETLEQRFEEALPAMSLLRDNTGSED